VNFTPGAGSAQWCPDRWNKLPEDPNSAFQIALARKISCGYTRRNVSSNKLSNTHLKSQR